jgi:hypothetical protein
VTAFGVSLDDQAAARCSDIIRTHIVAGSRGKWAAIRLSDGGSDGVAYDCAGVLCERYQRGRGCTGRADAVRHQLHERQCAYVRIPWDDMSPRAAAAVLRFHRQVYAAGLSLPDPDDHNVQPLMPNCNEAVSATLRGLRR